MVPNNAPDYRFRLLGILPLIFFLAQFVHYWRINELGNMLWMCNIGNLVLAIGLFIENRLMMRVAIMWALPGLFIWFLYVVLTWGVFFSSMLAHVGELLVAMIALRRIGVERLTWLYAFGWFLLLQLMSRLFTASGLNVNLAHKIQPGWEQWFSAYWQFWTVLIVVTALVLWGLEVLFRKIWPARIPNGKGLLRPTNIGQN